MDYKEINRHNWNSRVDSHVASDFYNMSGFLDGETSLKSIELDLLGDISGKSVLHLQCHFGQDSLSLARMGAKVTGVDISDKAIEKAKEIANQCGVEASFIACDVYDVPQHLDASFDVVFTTYGTIGWLPDLDRWARVVSGALKPGGRLIFVDFHPAVWMFDDDFKQVAYDYFNSGPIAISENETYADRDAEISPDSVSWNHSIAEMVTALLNQGLAIEHLQEFDYSPYPCFKNTEEFEPGKFRIKHLQKRIPMVYAVEARLKA